MNLSDLRNALPDYAKDLKLNLDSVLSETGAAGLDAKQIRVIALACAIAARHAPLVAAHRRLRGRAAVAGSRSTARAPRPRSWR